MYSTVFNTAGGIVNDRGLIFFIYPDNQFPKIFAFQKTGKSRGGVF
jgi:hypothetical protein